MYLFIHVKVGGYFLLLNNLFKLLGIPTFVRWIDYRNAHVYYRFSFVFRYYKFFCIRSICHGGLKLTACYELYTDLKDGSLSFS